MPNKIRRIKIKEIENESSAKKRVGSVKHGKLILIAALIIIFFVLWSIFSPSQSVFNYVFPSGDNLKKTEDRVNVLLLGNAGGKHDGAQLTDSIIVASYNTKTRQAMLISIPRDLWLESIGSKTNTAYEVGERESNGGNGLKFAEEKLGEIVGLNIHYGVRLDFNGFSNAVDQIGGIDVEVPRSFDDYLYPKEGAENDPCDLVEKEVELEATTAAILHLQPGKRKVNFRTDN